MKIWITRSSAFSIQCGGLGRLKVWFRKPRWVEEWRERSSYDTPFGIESEMNGAKTCGWEHTHDPDIDRSVSFGKLFGYNDRDDVGENEIANYVWKATYEHFGNSDFEDWDKYEKDHPECCVKNFILEIDLNISRKFGIEKSRCCGRCDGINDLCVADTECEDHEVIGCEICFGKR